MISREQGNLVLTGKNTWELHLKSKCSAWYRRDNTPHNYEYRVFRETYSSPKWAKFNTDLGLIVRIMTMKGWSEASGILTLDHGTEIAFLSNMSTQEDTHIGGGRKWAELMIVKFTA